MSDVVMTYIYNFFLKIVFFWWDIFLLNGKSPEYAAFQYLNGR